MAKDQKPEEQKPEEKKTEAKKDERAEKFDFDTYFMTREYQKETIDPTTKKRSYSVEEKNVIRPDYNQHILKCRIRAAKEFDVTVKHLKEAYSFLNGKKIDGVFVSDLINRFGFSDGKMISRADLAKHYGLNHINVIEIAHDKLREIIQKKNVAKAYMDYLNLTLAEVKKEETDKNLNN